MTLLTAATQRVLSGKKPKRIDIVYSHAHYDHIGAGTRFCNYAKRNFPGVPLRIWGSEATRKAIRRSKSKRAPEPTLIIGEEKRTLYLGGGLKVVMKLVAGHTSSDVLLHIPRKRGQPPIAMLVDIVFPKWSPFSYLAVTEDLGNYIDVHKELLKLDFDVFVGGHLLQGTRRDVKQSLKFVNDVVDAAAQTTRSLTPEKLGEAGFGKFLDPSAVEYENVWFSFLGVFRKLEIEGCYRIMLEKWGCKLAGLDFTLRSHCDVAAEYNVLDA